MPDTVNSFTPAPAIYTGISVLSSNDWVNLTTFFESAVSDNPTTTDLMRAILGMQKQDEFRPEFTEAVGLYAELKSVGQKFKTEVQDKMLGLADDIVQYNDGAAATYERLIELVDRFDMDGAPTDAEPAAIAAKWLALVKAWESGTPTGRSEQIKRNFNSALEQMIEDANVRAVRASALQHAILAVGDGVLARLNASKTAFAGQKQKFVTTLGLEGAANEALRVAMDGLNFELEGLRKKEHDEVLVLETSPVYLLIPFFGPFILAGIDIGVGTDLAITRNRIAGKVQEVLKIQGTMDTNARFMTYYTNNNERFDKIGKQIESLAPKLEILGLAWRAVASDLTNVHTVLNTKGRVSLQGENWFNLTVALASAKKGWAHIAAQADLFRKFGGAPKKVDNVDQLIDSIAKKAA